MWKSLQSRNPGLWSLTGSTWQTQRLPGSGRLISGEKGMRSWRPTPEPGRELENLLRLYGSQPGTTAVSTVVPVIPHNEYLVLLQRKRKDGAIVSRSNAFGIRLVQGGAVHVDSAWAR